jgi:hypothetical protein
MHLAKMLVGLFLLVILCHCREFGADPDQSEIDYLEKYGYLEHNEGVVVLSGKKKMSNVKSALLQFQEFAGLELSGELDVKTRETMKSSRCGNKDKGANFVKRVGETRPQI